MHHLTHHGGSLNPSCDLHPRNIYFFSLVEIVVTVLILSLVITFSTLQFRQSHRPEQLQESARQLSHFLQSSAQLAGLRDAPPMLTIDKETGTFSLVPRVEALDDFQLPDGILVTEIIGAEGSVWEDTLIEIPILAEGLMESLQITLSSEDLTPWTLTWKLKGLVCSVDQTPEIHWPVAVERF